MKTKKEILLLESLASPKSFGNLHKEWGQQIQISLLSGEDWVKKQIQADKFVHQGMVSVKCGLSKVNNK